MISLKFKNMSYFFHKYFIYFSMGHILTINYIHKYFKYISKINQINVLQNLAGHKCLKTKLAGCLKDLKAFSEVPCRNMIQFGQEDVPTG